MPSVSSCRTIRERLAPTARRTAISLLRVEARARSRLATLAQAISRTNPTMPIMSFNGTERSRTRSMCPRLPSTRAIALRNFFDFFGPEPGVADCSTRIDSAACARSRLTFGLSRPIKRAQPQLPFVSRRALPGMTCACIITGTYTSVVVPRVVPVNSDGAMPITVWR